MKIDHVHAEFVSGNAVSSDVTTHSVVSRDGGGNVHANKFKSANMELTHNAAERTSDSVFYSSNGDIVYKNTAAGMRSSLNFENSAMIPASSTNLASNIVVRNSSGNFSAGTITADLNGNAGTASSCSGNAATATALATARTIGGVSFDGTGNIDLPGVNAAGDQDTTGNAATATTAAACSGNAATATDADKVDGLEAIQFLRSDTSDTCSGTLYVSGGAWHHSLGWSAWRALSHGDHIVTSDDTQLQFYVSIRGANYIRSVGMVVTSDERVKTDVQTLDPEIALSKLEKIRPVSYKMKDTGQFTFGFIGQEIEKELPNVVNKGDGTLVDFNMMGEFSNKQSIKYQFEDEEKDVFMYTLALENPIPSTFDVDKVVAINASSVTGNSSVFLYDPEYCGKPEIGGTVMKLLHETELIEEGKYKIIGTETDDFRSLDYNEIFTVTTAALKEVNEQLKAEKIKTATLETKYEELLKRVEAIEAL